MKLKDSTFAIIAEKKDSISHKWFNENIGLNRTIEWVEDLIYLNKSDEWTFYTQGQRHELPLGCPIYTESEFEALLKAEQENEATQTFGGMTSTGGNAQTFPKNTVFGKEGIALKPSFELKGDGNVALDKNEPLAANKKEISQDDIKRAQYYLECFTKKIMPNYESTGDYSNLKDKGKIEMLVNDVYNVMLKNKDVESKCGAPIDLERLKSKLEDAEKAIAIWKSNCESKDNRIKFLEMDCERLNNVSKDYKDTIELIKRGAKMNEDDNQRLEKIIETHECKIKDLKEMLNQRDKIILGVSEKEQHNSRNKYNDAADALSYPMREIVEKFKVSEIKFPKSVFHPNGFVKPFKGVAITKSEAEKILRDKFKLPDYVEFKIVE